MLPYPITKFSVPYSTTSSYLTYIFAISNSNFSNIFLQVRWDDVDTNRHGRVSPWEIEPYGSVSSSTSFMAPGLKRAKMGLSSAKPEFPVPSMCCFEK